MKSYTITKMNGAPDWKQIPALQIDTVYQSADIRAWAKLCWDESGIYAYLQADEENIRAEENGVLGQVYQDSCLEFFIRPTQALPYFNFEWNPNGKVYLGFGTNISNLIRLAVPDEQKMFRPQPFRTEKGWGITFFIPFTFIQHFLPHFQAEEGLHFYGNCYKCGDLTIQPHYYSWNPIDPDDFTFHCPEYFGELILGGK